FIVLLSTMMLPAQVSLIPSFIIYTKLGWYGTYLPLTVAAYFAASPWNVFLMRQFFMGLPLELDEAAKIDGCGPVGILVKVIVPQSTAVMLTITLSTAVFWWNDYFYSLIYLQDQKLYPVALGLTAFDAKYFNNSALKAAATVMMLVPPILMFFFFQKFFIQGTVISGVKG
ncbi:MAG: carbohydrate ABC transporter permease, partial [Spirochaetales bacterium]|nr:carbohydrate ABC transporter permease [Spirochaetales bacterium]